MSQINLSCFKITLLSLKKKTTLNKVYWKMLGLGTCTKKLTFTNMHKLGVKITVLKRQRQRCKNYLPMSIVSNQNVKIC